MRIFNLVLHDLQLWAEPNSYAIKKTNKQTNKKTPKNQENKDGDLLVTDFSATGS